MTTHTHAEWVTVNAGQPTLSPEEIPAMALFAQRVLNSPNQRPELLNVFGTDWPVMEVTR